MCASEMIVHGQLLSCWVVKLFGHVAEMTSFSSRITDRRYC
jgi:hypothetical protein